MTQEQIKQKRVQLEEKLRDARYQVDLVKGEMEALKNRCQHPKEYKTSFMGDSGVACPDCGYAT